MAHAERVLEIAARERACSSSSLRRYLGSPDSSHLGFEGRPEGWYRGGARQWRGGLPGLGRVSGPSLRPVSEHHLVHRRRLESGRDGRGLGSNGAGHPRRRRRQPVHRPRPARVLAGRCLSRARLARSQSDLHLRGRPSQAPDRLEARSGLAVLPDRVDLRGRAQRFGASDSPAGLLVGAVRRQRPLHGQQADLAVRRRLASRARPAGIRGDGALGRVSSAACPGPSSCPISATQSSPRVWARRGVSTA